MSNLSSPSLEVQHFTDGAVQRTISCRHPRTIFDERDCSNMANVNGNSTGRTEPRFTQNSRLFSEPRRPFKTPLCLAFGRSMLTG